MLVAMWMTRDPATVRPSASIGDAATVMARQKFRHLLVTDGPGGRLEGIVSLHDLARAFPADVNPLSANGWAEAPRRQVADIMTRRLVTVAPDTPIEDAARLLCERKIDALPVVHAGAVAGILTVTDVLRAFVEVVGADVTAGAGARLTFDVSASEDAVAFVLDLARTRGSRVASVLTTHHEGGRLATARVVGGDLDGLIDAVWRSGHRVLSVVRS